MLIDRLESLRAKHWVKVHDNDEAEICVIPSGAGNVTSLSFFAGLSDDMREEYCKRVFVNFRGVYDKHECSEAEYKKLPENKRAALSDNGKGPTYYKLSVVKNSLEARMKLYDSTLVRNAVNDCVNKVQAGVIQGEDSAV